MPRFPEAFVVGRASGSCQPRTAPAVDAQPMSRFESPDIRGLRAIVAALLIRRSRACCALAAVGSVRGRHPLLLVRCHRQACTGTPSITACGLDSAMPRFPDGSSTRLAVPASRVQLLLSVPGPSGMSW